MLTKFILIAAALMITAAACPIPLVGEEFGPFFHPPLDYGTGVTGEYGRDYQYVILPPEAVPGPDWQLASFDHSSWTTGESVFSSTGDIEGIPTRTAWATDSDLFLFKTFWKKSWVPRQTLKAKLAVADGYELYLNGVLISSAYAEDFATHWEYTVVIPSSNFRLGTNELGIVAMSRGGQSAFDFVLWSVPEPGSRALAVTGIAMLAVLLRRRVDR